MVMSDEYIQANTLAMSLKKLRRALQRAELYPPLQMLLSTPDRLKACINWWNKCLEDKSLDDETLNAFSTEWQREIISKMPIDDGPEFNLYRDLLQFIITQIPLIKNLYHYPDYLRFTLQANEPWYHAQTYSKQLVYEVANGDGNAVQNPSMKNKWDENSLYGLLWAVKQDLRHEVKAILESIPPSQAQIKAAPLRQAICTRLYRPGDPDRAFAQSLAKEIAVLQDSKPPVKNIRTWLNQFTQPVSAETPSPDRILFWEGNEPLIRASLQVAHKAALLRPNGDFILQYHPQTGELKPADQCLPADRRHTVLPLPIDRPVAYAKFFPDAPGNEIAVSLLHDLLIGHGAPMTSLACFLPGTLRQMHPYPVLFSEAVQGPTLEEVLTKNQPLNLEPEHYSDMVLMAMLTIPLDGKPANYIVEAIAGTTLHRLVSVDNALSFGLPVTKQVTPDGYQLNLQLITILFCFDEMRQIIHSSSRKRWLALDSHALLQTWLNRLVAYNERCFVEGKLFPARACQHWHDREPQESVLLPFLLLPETIIDVYRRLKQIQSFLDKNPTCTHEELLDSMLPYVKNSYAPCWEQITLPVRDRFIQLAEQHNSIEIHHLPPSVAPAAGEAKEASAETLMISSRRLCHLEQTWISQIPTKLLSSKKDLVSFLSKVKAQANQYHEQLNRLKLRYDSVEALREHLHSQSNWALILPELQQLQTRIPEVLESVLNGEGIHSMRVKISQLSSSIQRELFSIINANPFRRLYLSECTLLTSSYLKQLLNSSPYLEALDVSGCIQLIETDILNIGIQCRKLKALNISRLQLTKLDISAYYPFLWTSLYFHFPELERLWVEDCLQLRTLNLETPFLQKLALQACPVLQQVTLYSENTVAIVPTLPFLRQQGCPQAMKLPNKVKEFLLTHPRASKLNVVCSDIGSYGSQQLSALLKINRSVTTLDLDYNQIGATGAQHLAEALKVNHSLTTLNLSSNSIGDTGAQHLAETLKVNHSLTTLNFWHNSIGATGAQHLAEALKVNHSLTTLDLGNNSIGDTGAQHLAEALKVNHSLTTLNFWRNSIGAIGAQHLAEALKVNHSLTTLNLSSNSIGDTGAQHLAEALKVNHSLTSMDLSSSSIGDTGAQHLAEALKVNHSLTTLNFWTNSIGEIGAQHLAEALKVNHSLTTLNLSSNSIRDTGAQHLAEALKVNHSLTTLNLSSNSIRDTGAQHLAEALKVNHSLTTLNLSSNSIRDTGAQHLAEALKVNHSLTTLNLSSNSIGDTGAQHLAEALKVNHSLTSMDLSSSSIGDTGAQHLAEALKVNHSLTSMDLRSNSIGDTGAQHLAEALKVNHSLTTLNLSSNSMGDTGAQHLAEALKVNRSLTTLGLRNNSIGATRAQHLAEALKVNHSLTTLDLSSNSIGEANRNIIVGYLTRNKALTKATKASESGEHFQPLIHKALASHTERDRLQGAHSLYTCGLQYTTGERVRPNAMTAAHYFKQAAEIGHGEAQLILAKAYKFGQGLPVQPLLALFWFARAQENGILLAFIEFSRTSTDLTVLAKLTDYLNPNKQSNVNWLADDPFESIPWHTLEKQVYWRNLTHRLIALNTEKTNHKVVDAQYILAQSYKNGEGVARSSLTAIYWCQKAARQRHDPAVNMLQEYHQLLGIDKNMLHPSSTDALPQLWSEVFREIPSIQAVSPPTNTAFQLFNLTNTETHPHTQRLFTFIQQLVHTTSDRFGYQSMWFEPARIKGLWEQGNFLKAFKKEWNQSPSHQGFISSIQMKELHLVYHPALWRLYQERKQRLKAELQEFGICNPTQGVHWQESLSNGLPVLDSTVGEVWLYHGTSEWGVNSILKSGFDPEKYCKYEVLFKLFHRGYGPLGRGTYLTDNFAKSATYVNAMAENDETPRHILVCRVLLGNIKTAPKQDRKYCDNTDLFSEKCHSVYGPRQDGYPKSKFDCNEFCINDGSQIYPEYVITYTLNPKRDPFPPIKIRQFSNESIHTSLRKASKQYPLNCQYASLEERIHEFEKLFDTFLISVQKCPESELPDYINLLEDLEKERLSLHPVAPQSTSRDSRTGSCRSPVSDLQQEGVEMSAISTSLPLATSSSSSSFTA